MISYELAKRLKDAGFNQHDKEVETKYLFMNNILDKNDRCYLPTLSELIETCGNKFSYLERGLDKKLWFAYSENWIDDDKENLASDYCGEGSTPEIAVANLWLALNEKK